MAFFVYTIYSESYDRFYIGQTQEFNTRLQRHNSGLEKFTSPYLPWTAMCIIEKTTRSKAMLLERKTEKSKQSKANKVYS
ncbi:MAG: GIY-YIG nuclease family protein [Chitinophagaceae bacterium]